MQHAALQFTAAGPVVPSRRRRAARAVALTVGIAAAAVGLGACGEKVDPATTATIGGERFTKITFEGLYRPDEGYTSKVITKKDLLQTEEFSVEGLSAQDLVITYDQTLTADGWTTSQEPQRKRDGSWWAQWQWKGRSVVVTAAPGKEGADGQPGPLDVVLSFQKPLPRDQITGVQKSKLG